MEYFYRSRAAELTFLKTELVDLVSSCLMREPPFEAKLPGKTPAATEPAAGDSGAEEEVNAPVPGTPLLSPNSGVATVSQIRELVHLISRQDGEFVLKLALYARHELHLRRSPSFLVALCAREPKCLPFLYPYMEKIIVLPSDWLAVANFSYFYDCDAAHDYAGILTYPPRAQEDVQATGHEVVHYRHRFSTNPTVPGRRGRYSTRSPSSTSRRSLALSGVESRSDTRNLPGASTQATRAKAGASASCSQKDNPPDPRRSHLPAALRAALVKLFAKFSMFSMAKYDNEAAERRARRRQVRRHRSALTSLKGGAEDESSSEDAPPETSPRFARPKTFTFKQLIRMLHITEPAYIVCCLLGKRYPASEVDFRSMRLHLTDPTWKMPAPVKSCTTSSVKEGKLSAEGTGVRAFNNTSCAEDEDNIKVHEENVELPCCVFDARRAGQRMRLPVPETWETQLSQEGNKGCVWDALISAEAVPYMALLRNLRNILTRLCSAKTHQLILKKLVDEQQVAASRQMPYRFYSAYLAVQEIKTSITFLDTLRAMPREARAAKERVVSTRRCGGHEEDRPTTVPKSAAEPSRKVLENTAKSFERPMVSRGFLHRYVTQYCTALDFAVNASARLNVIPMKGVTIVIVCITSALFEPMSAMGASTAAPASIQRKVDVAALLVAMLMRSCEQCVVLLYCYDEFVVFHERDPGGAWSSKKGAGGDDGASSSSWETDSSTSTRRSEANYDGVEGADSRASFDPVRGGSSTAPQEAAPRILGLVGALTARCSLLLERKRQEVGVDLVSTSFAMFADKAGAHFPYAFLDEVIERNMRVESFFVLDEGVHRTYSNMNRNAPAFGDLPVYLSRMRRKCSPDMVYVGVNLKASSPPAAKRTEHVSGTVTGSVTASAGGTPAPRSAAALVFEKEEVRLRFSHHNDILITGFSDSILRLVAERTHGGSLAVIERSGETYHVSRFSLRASQAVWAERARALKVVASFREIQKPHIGGGGAPAEPPTTDPSPINDDTTLRALSGTSWAANVQDSSLPCTRPSPAAASMTAHAAVLPSFDAEGKAVLVTRWDSGRRFGSSELRLQWLLSGNASLTSVPSAPGNSLAYNAGTESEHCATLPSIHRLLAKPSLSETEVAMETTTFSGARNRHGDAVSSSRDLDGAEVSRGEPAWLTAEGKHVSPIFHPQPFISIVKLLSMSSSRHEDSVTGSATSDATSVADRRKAGRVGETRERVRVTQLGQTGLSRSSAVDVTGGGGTVGAVPTMSKPNEIPKGKTCVTRHRSRDSPRRLSPAASAVPRRLITPHRVCRFFISSTFLDMNNERNAITLDIFPRLRRWAADAGLKVTLLEVDLRWGIPALATRRNLSTSVCLNEVSRCSPFFLGVLGERYGSSPSTPLQLVVDEDVDAEDYAWMQQLSDPNVSVTELEMRHAVYNARRRIGRPEAPSSVLFFTRDSPHLLSTFAPTEASYRAVYEAESATAANAVARLKQRLKDSGCTLIPYQAEYIRPSKPLLSGTSGCNSGGNAEYAPLPSSTSAMKRDDLGKWAVRSRHGFGGGTEEFSTLTGDPVKGSSAVESDSLWSLVRSRITASEEPRKLTSKDVAIDMVDFSNKVFHALQEVICRVCGVSPVHDDEEEEKLQPQLHAAARIADSPKLGATTEAREGAGASKRTRPSSNEAAEAGAPDEHEMLLLAQSEFARKLSNLYAAPRCLLEQLSNFALSGSLGCANGNDMSNETGVGMQKVASKHGTKPQGHANPLPSSEDALNSELVDGSEPLLRKQCVLNNRERGRGGSTETWRSPVTCGVAGGAVAGSILLLEGCDGDGKSSALAALTVRVLEPMGKTSEREGTPRFLFYSTQAEDDSVRRLLLFLAKSFQVFFQLFEEVSVSDTDSVDDLILVLHQIYDAIERRSETARRESAGVAGNRSAAGRSEAVVAHRALVVMLDGLDKSSEATMIVSLLGMILHPLATRHIRFMLSACPRSSLARAVRARTEVVYVLEIPLLTESERAALVRQHLASYGKLLEESFTADELKYLLRKSDSCRPSYLISAITHLRLFSNFDTLREDIRALPASRPALHVQLLHHLQSLFDPSTCRLVLSILVLRHPVGGVLEFNLYRLVSDVAAASRLVTLLRGICVESHHGRLIIKSSTFFDAIACACFRFASDYQFAQESVLLAELCYQAIDVSLEEREVRDGLRRVTESIQRSAASPLVQRVFVPERYAPRELLGVLQGSIQAGRLDVTAALVCYMPFLECLLVNRRMLSQLVGLLSSILSAMSTASSLALDASSSEAMDRTEDDGGTASAAAEDICSVHTFSSYRALALQWRHYRREARCLGDVLAFLQKHYHVLLRQPLLLRQCVWNTVGPAVCISAYDAASTERLQHALQHTRASGGIPVQKTHAEARGKRQRPEDPTPQSSPAPLPNALAPSILSMMWVRWINAQEHGGEGRMMLTVASPRSIRSMAMSPDGTEVALGGDDGILRRVPIDEEDPQQQPVHLGSTEADNGGGAGCAGRCRAASTLRHESAVTAVIYVASCTARGLTAGTNSTGTSVALSASTGAVGLLVSGCARGFVYIWRLGDNTLLQRGAGHLRAISGLVSHPLEPNVLCSSSHDSYVMFWGVAGAEATSRLCGDIQAALHLRMPKHPAGSAERLRQDRLRRKTREGLAGKLDLRGDVAGAAAVRHGAHSSSTPARSNQVPFPFTLTPFHTERQHHTPVADIVFHRSGDFFASGSWDGVLVLHNTRELCTPSPVIAPEMRVPSEPPKQRPFKGRLARRSGLHWRTRHGPEYRQVTFRSTKFELGSPVRALCFSNSLVVTCIAGCHNGEVVIVDYASASVVARWGSLHFAPVTRLSASLDGRCMASADEHGVVRLTHTGISGTVFSTINGHHGAVTGLCFRPLRAGQDADVSAGTDTSQAPSAVLLTAGEDCTLQAWRVDMGGDGGCNTQSPMSRHRLPVGHFTAVTAVASSLDGHLLVTGSEDGTAIVYRMPEGTKDDDITSHWARGAAVGGGGAGASELSKSHSLGKRLSYALMTSGSGAKTQGSLKPAFTLKHDGCRITRICLALRDTRIVVGVVFGLVYVWSSSPGLNQVEGRLLLRVRVPEHGLYPVVSLSIVEQCCSGWVASDRCRGQAQEGTNTHIPPGEMLTSALGRPLWPGYRHVNGSAAAAAILTSPSTEQDSRSTAVVTAVCANGDLAVFEILDDAASHFMAADQARRQERRAAHRSRDFPHGVVTQNRSLCSVSSESTIGSTTADDDTGAAPPTTTSVGNVECHEMEGVTETHTSAIESLAPMTVVGSALTQVTESQSVHAATSPVAHGGVRVLAVASAPSLSKRATSNEILRSQRHALDQRSLKLQRLLTRCRVAELGLRSSHQLRLHRYRFQWENASHAEEITGVVWLSARHLQCDYRKDDRVGACDAISAGAGEGQQFRLALVVAQRRLFLLLSNDYEGVLSRPLTVRVSSCTPHRAVVRESTTGAMPVGGIVTRPPVWDTFSDGTKTESSAAPPVSPEVAAAEGCGVDLDHVLRAGEYFTSASTAIEVVPTAASPRPTEATELFAVAVTTSHGEALVFRVEVPQSRGGMVGETTVVPTDKVTDAGRRALSAVSQCLDVNLLPKTSVTLCQRLCFSPSTSDQPTAGAASAAAGTRVETDTNGAAIHRITAVPHATSVELCTLPLALGSVLDASAVSPFSASSCAEVGGVVVIAGCTDGSTRVWLASTLPPPPHLHGASADGDVMDHITSSRRCTGRLSDISIGCFFCRSGVTAVSGFLKRSAQYACGSGFLEEALALRWVVGDALGNVYQLQLKQDAPGGVDALLGTPREMLRLVPGGARSSKEGNIEARLARLAAVDRNTSPWSQSLQGLLGMMSHAPLLKGMETMLTPTPSGDAYEPGFAADTTKAGEDASTLMWPGWSSRTPVEWFTRVDVSSSLPRLLRRSVSATIDGTHLVPERGGTGDNVRSALSSSSPGTVEQEVSAPGEAMQESSAPRLQSADAERAMATAPWSCLPDMSWLKRADAAAFSHTLEGTVGGVKVGDSDKHAYSTLLGGTGFTSPPAPLPSFATAPRTIWNVWDSSGVTGDERNESVGYSFRMPCTSLLGAYSQQEAGAISGASQGLGGTSNVNPPRRDEWRASPRIEVSSTLTTQPPSSPADRSLLHAGQHQQPCEDEEGYFAILYETEPSISYTQCRGGAEGRCAWLLHQNEVLKEAMRVQRYNKVARRALEAYHSRRTAPYTLRWVS